MYGAKQTVPSTGDLPVSQLMVFWCAQARCQHSHCFLSIHQRQQQQCDQIERFFKKIWVKNYVTKVAQTVRDFWAILKHHVSGKNCVGKILGNFWKNWITSYFSIWSHWQLYISNKHTSSFEHQIRVPKS